MVNINIEIPDELHKKIKLLSVMHDCTVKDFIINALDEKIRRKKS